MSKANQLSTSLEDYLEVIFNIISANDGVRVKDIASELDVKADSVTIALQALAKAGYINYKPYGVITLTSKGLGRAQQVARKHDVLQGFFVDILGVDSQEAESAACKIEHAITDKLLSRLISFTEYIKVCPQCGNNICKSFHDNIDESSDQPGYEQCIG